jgi:hypothetical protein
MRFPSAIAAYFAFRALMLVFLKLNVELATISLS